MGSRKRTDRCADIACAWPPGARAAGGTKSRLKLECTIEIFAIMLCMPARPRLGCGTQPRAASSNVCRPVRPAHGAPLRLNRQQARAAASSAPEALVGAFVLLLLIHKIIEALRMFLALSERVLPAQTSCSRYCQLDQMVAELAMSGTYTSRRFIQTTLRAASPFVRVMQPGGGRAHQNADRQAGERRRGAGATAAAEPGHFREL